MPNAPESFDATKAGVAKIAGTANYCPSLDSTGLVPTAQLGTGSASATTFLRGDRTYATVGSGTLKTMVIAASTTVTTGTTGLNHDNTPILSTEGDQYLAATIAPSASGSRLFIHAVIQGSTVGIASNLGAGLFLAGSSSAVLGSAHPSRCAASSGASIEHPDAANAP